ncbi:MAG: hypothetical protein F6K28_59590, partial [Microcoleus sp. SIO2G3]|nr:hypothetical protein [Microcoleus sp. SIO2G3]
GVGGAPSLDATGKTRDSKPDIGAIEFSGSTGGSSGSNNLTLRGTSGADTLTGGGGRDRLIGNGGNDILIGKANADTLTGNAGADRFVYSGTSANGALAGSRVANLDRITDFQFGQGDRFQLDYDNNLVTREQPSGLFNAGTIQASSLTNAAKAAYEDKNQRTRGKQALNGNEAVFFNWQNKTYLSVNNGAKAFNASQDLVADATGIRMKGGDATASVLNVGNYFA